MLSRDEFFDALEQVLEIMYKTSEREPSADDAVQKLNAPISERDKDSLANAAYFKFDEYCNGR